MPLHAIEATAWSRKPEALPPIAARLDPVYPCGVLRLSLLLALVVGCSGSPKVTDTPPPTHRAPGSDDVWAVPGELSREDLPAAMPALPLEPKTFPSVPAGVPPAPASCKAFTDPGKATAACADRAQALASLDDALTRTQPAERDAGLLALEGCTELPPGLVRALRAELAPVACADTIVVGLLTSPPPGIDGAVYDTLFGLGLAGMLSRAAATPPAMPPPHTKETVGAFVAGPMKAWVTEQAQAIQTLGDLGAKLRYYGKAIVAIEAGMADMRFIDAVRTVPVPQEYAGDEELKHTYLVSLEDALEPRKKRGRDATLVGLGSFATLGVLRDDRVARARELLSRMYGGSRVDALDVLMLPPLPASSPATTQERLAGKLPTLYASMLFSVEDSLAPGMLRALLEKGVALPLRIALAGRELAPTERQLYARARFELGQNYWRRVDFDEAVRLLDSSVPDDSKLVLALALALRGGPENAADMMVKAPAGELGVGNTRALEAVAATSSPVAPLAGFDAAYVRELAAPAEADEAYWRDVAARYRAAAALFQDALKRNDAEERAKEADETAAAAARARSK
jgi:hypothetical protein